MIKTYIATLVAALLLDALWIGLIMNGFYKSQLSPLLRMKADGGLEAIAWAGAMVYILIPLGVVLFVLPKVSEEQSLWVILPWGFIFGLVLYGVYDYTNYALLKEWTLAMTLVDWVWGGVICALSAVVALFVHRL